MEEKKQQAGVRVRRSGYRGFTFSECEVVAHCDGKEDGDECGHYVTFFGPKGNVRSISRLGCIQLRALVYAIPRSEISESLAVHLGIKSDVAEEQRALDAGYKVEWRQLK